MALKYLKTWAKAQISKGHLVGCLLRRLVLFRARWTGTARAAGEFPRYREWRQRHVTAQAKRFSCVGPPDSHTAPMVSVVIPTYQPDLRHLDEALSSVQRQDYPNWEAVVVDDGGNDPEVSAWLNQRAASERRIRIVTLSQNGGISRATNAGVDVAIGDVIAFLDHDDILEPFALSAAMQPFLHHADCQLVFTDEDKVDGTGRRFEPYLKPGFNRALLYARNYVNHLTLVRRSAFLSVGALDPARDGAQDYDLVLKVLESFGPDAFRHVPAMAYSWRKDERRANFSASSASRSWLAGAKSLKAHLDRQGLEATTVEKGYGGGWRIRFSGAKAKDRVCVIIPTRDRPDLLEACLDTVEEVAPSIDLELVIVDNDSVDPKTLALFDRLPSRFPRARVLRVPGEFNYSRMMNIACRAADSPKILFLNNDIANGRDGWLAEMIGWANMPWVGSVGARLLYPDGRLQHGGVILGPGSAAGHYERFASAHDVGAFGHLRLPRCCSAVTAACLMVRREVFDAVGGFDEDSFPVAFSDVDFCLRLRAAGYENVWTPYAELTHFEGASRGREVGSQGNEPYLDAQEALQVRWGQFIEADPYSNPSINSKIEQVTLCFDDENHAP